MEHQHRAVLRSRSPSPAPEQMREGAASTPQLLAYRPDNLRNCRLVSLAARCMLDLPLLCLDIRDLDNQQQNIQQPMMDVQSKRKYSATSVKSTS